MASIRSDDAPRSGWFRDRLVVGVVLGVALVWSLFAGIAYQIYGDEWDRSAVFAKNVASLIERDIARNIEFYDLSIRAAGRNYDEPGIKLLPPDLQHRFVFDESADASGFGSILILDRFGKLLMESRGLVATGADFSDRENFIFYRDHGVDQSQLFISHSFKSRISASMGIGLSRRRTAPDGSFNGVVIGMIKLDYFAQLFAAAELPPNSTITLIHRDGTILIREPERQEAIGRNMRPDAMFAQIERQASSGMFIKDSAVDDVQRLFAYKQIGSLPMYMVVGLSTDEFRKSWRWRAQLISLGFVLLSGIIVVLGVMLARELDRRADAESELYTLAATDGLTQLANRRHFDKVLEIEWRRAKRDATCISLLMVDADFFKAFNDSYGHVGGDEALRSIARILQRCITRPGDLVVRFGGEEFTALLPRTDRHGADTIARAVRAAIAEAQIAHRGSPLGRMTVSIGLATYRPILSDKAADLIAAADSALYAAKAAGRDRIVSAFDHDSSRAA